MDTEKVTNKYGSYTDYDCYNVFNDDVVMVLFQIIMVIHIIAVHTMQVIRLAYQKKQQKSLYQQDVEFL